MARGTIIESFYNEEEGYSYLVKATKLGAFFADALADEEDREFATEWDGYKICEAKCDIMYYKEKAKVMRERYLGILYAYQNLTQDGEESVDLDRLKRQVDVAYRDWKKAASQYKSMQESFTGYCAAIVNSRKILRQQHEQMKKRQNS